MATYRKSEGIYIVQMILHEDEYTDVFTPIREESGLSESSFLRVRCELPALKPRGIPGKKKKRKKSAPVNRAKRASGLTKDNESTLPFVGHREDAEETVETFEEIIDESVIPPPQPVSETTGEEQKSPAKSIERSDYGLDILEI